MPLAAQFGKDSTSGGPSGGNVQFDPSEAAQYRDPIFDAVYSVRRALYRTELMRSRVLLTLTALPTAFCALFTNALASRPHNKACDGRVCEPRSCVV